MKYILTIAITLLIFWSCSDDSSSSNDSSNSFTTANVNQTDTYFTFSTEKADTIAPTSWDVLFTSVVEDVYRGGCTPTPTPTSMIFLGNNATGAKVSATEIDEVTTIPDASEFKNDINELLPVIGKKWYTAGMQGLEFSEEVYAVKTCDGKFCLLQPYYGYYTGPPNHQVEDIKWRIKYNNNGSNDFTDTVVDSFTADNAYTEKQYYSFFNNSAVIVDSTYQIVLDGSNILVGGGSIAKNLGITDINSVSIVSDDSWEMDETARWYDYNLNGMHRLTPKNIVYVIHTENDKYVAMEIVGYNDGEFTVFWKYLE